MPDENDKLSTAVRHLMIRGRVQGVSYRASAQAEAMRLGLRGWVRNRRDGTVEALVTGADANVASFIAWARNGPAGARVEHVEVSAAEAVDADAFVVRPTL
jgi:acylphosphatase